MGNSSAVQPYYPVLKEVIRIWDPDRPFNCSTAATEVSTILIAVQSVIRKLAADPDCEEKVIPFFCSYLLPTCNSDGEVAYATVEECEYIRDDACKTVWTLASFLTKYRSLLPSCSELLNITTGNYSRAKPRAKPPTCHPLFVQTECVCLPSCGTFRTRTDNEQAIEDTTVFLAIIACFVSTTIYVAFLVKRQKAM